MDTVAAREPGWVHPAAHDHAHFEPDPRRTSPVNSAAQPTTQPTTQHSSRSGRQQGGLQPVASIALRAKDVAELTATSGYPCISLLMPTQPAARLTPADFDHLHRLAAEVDRTLGEQEVAGREHLMARLSAEAQRAATQPADHALAIYVSPALTRSFRLPQSVAPRAVVEQTFATRPLISALHRMPPHVVLVLHSTCAHLYAAADGGLHPVDEVDPFRGSGRIRLPAPGDPDADEVGRDLSTSYLQAVDRMLGDYRAGHPSPLVLAGSPRLLDRFCALSGNLERLAGRLSTDEEDTAFDLVMACTWALDEYLKNRREEAMEKLSKALGSRPAGVATGIDDCWRALPSRAPRMLLVEESFVSPGLAIEGPGHETARVGVSDVHDLVDDLIEQVILQGGQLALVRDGDLRAHGRIALICGEPVRRQL